MVQCVLRNTIEHLGYKRRAYQLRARRIVHQSQTAITKIDLTAGRGNRNGHRRHGRVEGSIVHLECERVGTSEPSLRRVGQIGRGAYQCSIRRLSDHREFDRSAFRIPAGQRYRCGLTHHRAHTQCIRRRCLIGVHSLDRDGHNRHRGIQGTIVYFERETVGTREASLGGINHIRRRARQRSIRRQCHHRVLERPTFRILAR